MSEKEEIKSNVADSSNDNLALKQESWFVNDPPPKGKRKQKAEKEEDKE